MKSLLLILVLVGTAAQAQEKPKFEYEVNSPAVLEAKAKYAGYEKDGQALKTFELYKELERLDAAKKTRIALMKPEEAAASIFMLTDDDMRAVSYGGVLQKRGENGDPLASFYYGVRQWDACLRFEKLGEGGNDGWAKSARECWQGVLPALRKASDAQIADASFNIAKIYQNGKGVTPSKLAAAEWYVKASEQYTKQKDREEALTALEKALDLVPDHPAALRLRKAMLK
ncbi:hypothetical protein ACG02S_00950 [Roseateles sp. DC23W]|uniref:TPR repeat n=1 Tax=Pelomonas dachongensis TaxID=3299029 RepID=A0ABW7EI62_9BURK